MVDVEVKKRIDLEMGTKRDLIKEKSRSVYKMVWANM